MMYESFKKTLDEALYRTTKKLADSQATSTYHYREMFEKLEIEEAKKLLIDIENHEEFHPDMIKVFKSILKRRNNNDTRNTKKSD